MSPEAHRLYAAIEATWPPASRTLAGPWMLRDGNMQISLALPYLHLLQFGLDKVSD